jgi:hypothetical protein
VASQKAVSRAVYGVFMLITTGFVLASIAQVAGAVFAGDRVHGVASAGCAAALREHASALDRALAAAAPAADLKEAERLYQDALGAHAGTNDGDPVACASDPVGADAMAALARLRRATESAVRRQSSALGPVRREVDSFIR